MNTDKPLVVTMGEPAGVGPDIILEAFAGRAALDLPFFYVVGDSACLEQRAGQLGLSVNLIKITRADEASSVFQAGLPVLEFSAPDTVVPGQITPANAGFVIGAIDQAVRVINKGHAGGLVTGPIHKQALMQHGFEFPGHTEYLAALADKYFPQSGQAPYSAVMMLAAPMMRVVPLTIHVPLKDVFGLINEQLIVSTVSTVAIDLQNRFGIKKPRIVVTGLNPHAGEGGELGREEIEIISPAIAQLKASGYDVTGPVAADTAFHAEALANVDAVMAMYHDQALIPIKTVAFDEGVNVTLGLPFIRTSPDHGTALELAGTGRARAGSFVAALKLAAEMGAKQAPAPAGASQ